MNANIEALVKKHSRAFSGDVRGLRNALTEQAEAFKGELQAYDGMVRELTKTVEDMRAAQFVPVAGNDIPQDWKGVDGAVAWHLMDRHGEGWAHIGQMMDEWAAANAAQFVPVVGEPVAYLKADAAGKVLWSEDCVCEDAVWPGEDSEFGEYSLPVYHKPTTSIPAAELATLRELADAFTAERKARDSIAFEFNKVSRELEALRTEAERWRKANEGGKFCISEWAAISKEWVDMLPETAIERIDAAIAQGKGE